MSNKVKKTVSFNTTNQYDVEMLVHTENLNFSGYVKELIAADIQKRKQPLQIIKKTESGGIKIVVG
ncbi:hypothetical protein M670_00115 [Schinkia azotoformans MEV2011]|uniref:Uncharacterized protein n=1 Tax=Schinkia azotoformans MEV2011 TaxID=1348973 RepID=A0A072P3T2_SCHAZ|nr:hypothetical protein [Schinkia azotoformans]KEF40100.1 hypothetical protein M670_00115 [Schinkia azotoformans MEV2011]